MALLRFNNRYRVTLYYQGNVLMQFFSDNVNTNIDFEANIIKDGFSNGNSRSTFFFYNLSPDKRNTIEALVTQSKLSSMQLMIETTFVYGQQNQYQLLTYEDVVGAYNEQGDGDYKTNLITKSGEANIVSVYGASSYPPGTKLSQILPVECQKLVDGNSIKSVSIKSIIDYTFPYGYVFSGNLFNFLSKLCYENGNLMFVDNGVLTVAAASWFNSNNPYQNTLNFYNGLLEAPHVGQNNFTQKFQSDQSSVSFMFKALLLPGIAINDSISVLNQQYTVKRINHSIRTRAGEAYSVIEGYVNGSV